MPSQPESSTRRLAGLERGMTAADVGGSGVVRAKEADATRKNAGKKSMVENEMGGGRRGRTPLGIWMSSTYYCK